MQSRFYRRSAPGARPRARGDKQIYRLRLPLFFSQIGAQKPSRRE
jgi:hypothetical protein